MQNIIKHYKHITIYNILSILCLVMLFLTIISPISTSPDSSLATTGTAVPSVTSLTLDSTSSSASVSLIVNDTNGTFAESTANAQFSVTTNNYTGYTLNISDDGSSTLVSNTSSDDTISSITNVSGISSSTFDNASYNGYWGYRPSKYNSAVNSNYLPSPSIINSSTHSVVLDTTSSANNTANSYTIGLAMRADYTKPAGTYTKTLSLAAVANPIIYSITYNKNTTDTVSNMPSNIVSESTDDTNIALQNLTPVRSGYTFQGWCLGTVSADGTTCTGTTFQPNGSYGIDQTGDNRNVNLIAMWKQDKIYIQDFTISMCSSQASSSPVVVYDRRDDQAYTVRYINGGCWMTRNLAIGCNGNGLEYGSLYKVTTLTSNESNVASSWNTPTTSNLSTSVSFGSGTGYTTATIDCSSTYGAWYNYCSASAGTICTGNYISTETTYSICPKNWNLPSVTQFNSILGSKDLFSPTGGGVYDNNTSPSQYFPNAQSAWYSSTPETNWAWTHKYLSYYNDTLTVAQSGRGFAYYVRCILK